VKASTHPQDHWQRQLLNKRFSPVRSEGQNQGLKRESGREEERKKDSASERAGEFSPEGLHDLPFSVFIALESVERERLQR